MSTRLIGWRVCVGKRKTHGWLVRPLFKAGDESYHFISIGLPLPKAEVHVGTSRGLAMDYYANSTDLQSDECELLLKLDCTFSLLPPTDREKWNYATPTEAKAMCPEVLDIEIIRDANVCKQQHEQSKSRS